MCQGAINMESALALELEVSLAVEGGLQGDGIGAGIAGALLTSQLNSSKYDLGSTYTLSIITDLPMEQVSSGMAIINGCKEKHYDDPAEIDANWDAFVAEITPSAQIYTDFMQTEVLKLVEQALN